MRVAKSEGTKVRDYNLSASYDVIIPHFFLCGSLKVREQKCGIII